MFNKVGDPSFVQGEHEVLKFWEARRVFEKRRARNAGKPKWSFLDGPITANNPMGVHHAWGRTYKDTFQRYQAMKGRELRYQQGFDCQGLWVEVEVERELGLLTKSAIEEFGIDRFVDLCKRRVLRFAARQTEQSIRLGYWMDWDRPDELRKLAEAVGTDQEVTYTAASGAEVRGPAAAIAARLGNPEWGGSYFTFSTENNETIWAFLKTCYEKGKVYRSYDVMPWSGRSGSAYSQMEVADGRRLTTHRSLFVRFPLEPTGPDKEYLLVWTTTPWTLTSNVAAAVNVDLPYARVRMKRDGSVYYVAQANLESPRLEREFREGFGRGDWGWPKGVPKLKPIGQIFKESGGYEVEALLPGAELVGRRYSGPFDDLEAQRTPGGYPPHFRHEGRNPTAVECHRVIDGGRDSKGNPNVTAGEGTGIVHIATGCGDVDHRLGEQHGLVAVAPLDDAGRFRGPFGEFTGMAATDPAVTDLVIQRLRERELLVASEQYPHVYPFCWRTGDELVFRLVDEWLIRMDWRDQIIDVARQVNWLPEGMGGEAREVEWLTNMQDWMISKKRFWGLALPIWFEEYQDESGRKVLDFEVMGSLDELRRRAAEGEGWEEFAGNTPHRPWIDRVKIRNPKTGNLMSRVRDVGNPWLDAGIVPFSTMQYNTDRETWAQWYPADLVLECFPGQFRNWFYSLLSMATMMDGTPPFRNLLGHRLVMNEDGKPMHKSDGTAIWFEEAAEQLGVDALRWLYLTQDPATDLRFGRRLPDQPVTLQTADGPVTRLPEGMLACKVESKAVEEVRRQFLIPLWNSYAFFVNYARLDAFDPRDPEVPPAERPEIDRWVLSRLQALIRDMTGALDGFDTASACRAAAQFVDHLSNWYIRRNRRRFWRSQDQGDQDKLAAYQTLYTVLLTLTRLLAPMLPFLTERLYANLVGGWFPDHPESVHLGDYPAVDPALLNEELNATMETAQLVVRLGYKVREDHKLRVRQPLSELRVACDTEARREAVGKLSEVIRDELNVKTLVVTESLGDLVVYTYRVNPKTLGPRYGKSLGAIKARVETADPAALAPLALGRSVSLEVDGHPVELGPGDVLVSTSQAADWASASEQGVQVAISTALTPALVREGAARDFVRQVQQLRKEEDLEISQRIDVFYLSDHDEMAAVVREWGDYIRQETLADAIRAEPVAPEGSKLVEVGSVTLRVWIERR